MKTGSKAYLLPVFRSLRRSNLKPVIIFLLPRAKALAMTTSRVKPEGLSAYKAALSSL